MKKFIFIRGLPGSGKSSLAKELVEDGQIFSTDDYFHINPEGTYQFDKTKLGKAHAWNQRRVEAALDLGFDTIIVDNTSTTLRELKSYAIPIRLALGRGYQIELREPDTEWKFDVDKCFELNTHGVPKEAIQRMKNRYEHGVTVDDIIGKK